MTEIQLTEYQSSHIHKGDAIWISGKLPFLTFSPISFCLFLTLLLLKLHVAVVHNGSSQLVHRVLFLLCEAQYIKGTLWKQKTWVFDCLKAWYYYYVVKDQSCFLTSYSHQWPLIHQHHQGKQPWSLPERWMRSHRGLMLLVTSLFIPFQ